MLKPMSMPNSVIIRQGQIQVTWLKDAHRACSHFLLWRSCHHSHNDRNCLYTMLNTHHQWDSARSMCRTLFLMSTPFLKITTFPFSQIWKQIQWYRWFVKTLTDHQKQRFQTRAAEATCTNQSSILCCEFFWSTDCHACDGVMKSSPFWEKFLIAICFHSQSMV